MLYLILLVLLILFYLWVNRVFLDSLDRERTRCKQLNQDLAVLLKKHADLRTENEEISRKAEYVIELYEVTKDVCKSMDEDKVFEIFKEKLKHYIKVDSIQFIKEEVDYQLYKDSLLFPLDIGIKPTYFLVAEGVPETEQEQFYILAQQFLLGVRRAALYRRIQDLAIHDGLTRILTRRYFLERLNEEIKRAEKFRYVFSFLMLDIDYFKQCNDRYGHLVGDAALSEVAKVIKDNTRQIDIVGRYGGEEFSIILSETSKESAISASERILESIEEKKIKAYDEEIKLTVSIGISAFPEDGNLPQELIDKSDWALYRAKQTGRNRICAYGIYK